MASASRRAAVHIRGTTAVSALLSGEAGERSRNRGECGCDILKTRDVMNEVFRRCCLRSVV